MRSVYSLYRIRLGNRYSPVRGTSRRSIIPKVPEWKHIPIPGSWYRCVISVCFSVPLTYCISPAPIRLLINVLVVEAKAITVMKGIADTLRIILVMASERSPRCSTAMKNKNQVDMDRKFCIIVHKDTFRMRFNIPHWMPEKWFKPYFLKSIFRQV